MLICICVHTHIHMCFIYVSYDLIFITIKQKMPPKRGGEIEDSK